MSDHDEYMLSRDHRGAARLNYQHFLWREAIGFNIHPSIHVDPSKRYSIADVACGTGLWVSEVALKLPKSQVDGFDISLAHSPPAEWQPTNSRIIQWDMFTEPLHEWVGAYDIVHVRLVQLVIENGDPLPLLRQMAKLLKPGGYFQWDELDTGASYILRTNDCQQHSPDLPTMDRIVKMLAGLNSWIPRLADKVTAVSAGARGGQLASDSDRSQGHHHNGNSHNGDGWQAPHIAYEEARVYSYRDPLHIARAFFDMHLTKDEEMAETSFKGTEQGEGIIRNISSMLEESRAGAVLCTPKLVLVCKRRSI